MGGGIMSRNTITINYNDDNTTVCKCGGKLVYQKEWDKLYDNYDRNTPAGYLVVNRLYNEDVPKYICDSCNVEVLVVCK